MPTVNDPNEALRIDSSCEAAIAMLAQLNLQQSKIEKAEELFSRQAELARSEQELGLRTVTVQYGLYGTVVQVPVQYR